MYRTFGTVCYVSALCVDSICNRPLPSCFLFTYSKPISAFGDIINIIIIILSPVTALPSPLPRPLTNPLPQPAATQHTSSTLQQYVALCVMFQVQLSVVLNVLSVLCLCSVSVVSCSSCHWPKCLHMPNSATGSTHSVFNLCTLFSVLTVSIFGCIPSV
jgi:hypothetical protein